MENNAAVVAESQPAQATQEVTQPASINDFTAEERHEWRKTGNWPDRKATAQPKTEVSAPSKDSSADSAKSESAPASEAGKQTQETKTQQQRHNADSRKAELNAEIKELLRKRDELRKETQAPAAAPTSKTETPAASSTAAAPQELKPPVKPDPNSFKTWGEYEAARDEYFDKLSDYKAAKAIEGHKQALAQEQQRQTISKQMEEARKAYPDWDTVGKTAINAVWGDGKPESGVHPAIKHAIGSSPIMTHLLYVLGGDKELAQFVDLSRKDPARALMKLGAMEALLVPELEKAGKDAANLERNDKGQFTTTKTPEKKVSSAPPPAKEVGGPGTPPADARVDAQKRGDFEAYRSASNARDLARFKTRR
jgi:hypothetical protein